MESERAVSVWTKLDARKLFCRLAVTITVKLCDMASISFKDLRYLLSVIGPSEAETDSFKEVQEWCLKGFGEGWLSKECKQAIKSFLETVTGVPESEVKTAESLVKMLAFIPTKSSKDTLDHSSRQFYKCPLNFFSNTNLFEIKAVCLHKLAHPIGTPFKVIEKYAMVLQHVLRLLPQPMQALITTDTNNLFTAYTTINLAYTLANPWDSASKYLANQRIGIMEHVATPFLSAWESAHPAHLDIFITLLSFGPTRDKNMDADRVDAAISYILHTAPIPSPPNLSKETAELNFNCRDYAIRVRANAVLLRNRDPEVSVRVLEALVGEMESGMWKAKFDNTHEHRMQIRIWSSIHLVIEDIPNNKDWADRIVRLLDLDVVASTRYYLEWAVMRVFLKYPGMVESVWSWLDRFDAKSTTLCSILSVLLHTLPHQPEAIQSHLYSTLFTKITPWLTSNHFTIRLYAQYVLFTLWNHCEAPYLQTVKTTHSYLSSLVNFIQSNHDCIKHRQQVAKAFFVGGGFDPTLDLSVDFVFRWGWRALGVTEEERISAHAFQRVGLKEEDSRIPLFSDKSRIALIESQSPVTSDDDTSIPEEPTPTATTDLTALQRKFEPWETMLETDFDFSPSLAREANVRKRFPLIVVASLVSKSPNLGGLCRTCEIFNAEMLVLPTLKVVEDPAFLVTAVTSEKWMPMMEIRPDPSVLLPYLSAKKLEGYSILGIEQATTSVSLDTFEFPQKCVLLLGMEKLGIPAVYMPLLDYILEIPQYGVIRSLNVHVSGALVLANFAKQQKAV
ncbi:hypothetical protein BCR33DRAFT_720118 [Rhizoclosmatium globosum]|uniref:tRNA/rRNA methyltransferase SpoU type domain-containing protein n=1 Tax=Rhizoclosmatium globosum TaxID=329046 RepID=A0A1Y2BWY4_9FUNG|nr:hypothetical protein BCR33DRAFT_720118 [Rhizoclosmatium globosum]|eukprot:ORY39279.1 hypothetical protein BCR33DRAFT_720118 [Rhizoclosmatium globosum]